MFYNIKSNQKVYIEISNLVHGGKDWEFGTCLWSPITDSGGARRYMNMEEVSPGDLIIHTAEHNNNRLFFGASLVASKVKIINNEPPIPGKWAGRNEYYKIELESYSEFNVKPDVKSYLVAYNNQLNNDQDDYYSPYGNNGEIRLRQKYLANVSHKHFLYINEFLFNSGLTYAPVVHYNMQPTTNEPKQPDSSPPMRTSTYVSRIIRDTSLTRNVKRRFNYKCQICGLQIVLNSNNFYSEGHHIQPLGTPHNGPDIESNIIILCPNHHTEFDYGLISVDLYNGRIIHSNQSNPLHGQQLSYNRNDIEQIYVDYHNNNIFNN